MFQKMSEQFLIVYSIIFTLQSLVLCDNCIYLLLSSILISFFVLGIYFLCFIVIFIFQIKLSDAIYYISEKTMQKFKYLGGN